MKLHRSIDGRVLMSSKSFAGKRLYELDGLRGVAALWVGLYHFWGAIQKRDTDWVPESVFEFFEAGFFGVDIFFVSFKRFRDYV